MDEDDEQLLDAASPRNYAMAIGRALDIGAKDAAAILLGEMMTRYPAEAAELINRLRSVF